MGKKSRISRNPQKFGRKYSSHPIVNSRTQSEPAEVAAPAPVVEEVIEPVPEPVPVVEPAKEAPAPPAKKRAVKRSKAKAKK